MVWEVIYCRSSASLEGALGEMYAKCYTTTLFEELLPAADDTMKNVWTLEQDSALVHFACRTHKLFEDNDA